MKRRASVIACLLMIAVTVINMAYLIKDSFFYSLENLPTGTFIREDFDQNILFSEGYKLDSKLARDRAGCNNKRSLPELRDRFLRLPRF